MYATPPLPSLYYALFYAWLFCAASTAYAQYELRPAELLTSSGLRLRGDVKFYDWDRSPDAITFIDSITHQEQTYTAREVQRLAVSPNRLFEGKLLSIVYYIDNAASVEQATAKTPEQGWFMPELLYESSLVKLYRLYDKHKMLRLYLQKEGQLHALEDIHVQIKKQDRLFTYEDPQYKRTLKTLLSECPTLNTNPIPYQEKPIIDLLNEYHQYCRIDGRIYNEQKNLGKYRVSIGGFYDKYLPFDVISYGVSVQVQAPRRFHQFFILCDIGLANWQERGDKGWGPYLNVAAYGGRYWPLVGRHLQLLGYTGISSLNGPLDTAVGLSFDKRLSVTVGNGLIGTLVVGALAPYLNCRLLVPLK